MKINIYNENKPVSFSTYLAIGSFVIGTLLLLLYLSIPSYMEIIIFGYLYVLFATLINSIVLLNLCYQFITKPLERESIAIRILILLSNIPITILYIFIIFNNLNN